MCDYIVRARAQLRAKVTRFHNDRENFLNYSSVERQTVKFKLEKLNGELCEFNTKIAQLKFSNTYETEELDDELLKCDQYSDRICECLSMLSVSARPEHDATSPAASHHSARSLLRSPTAPLPHFYSDPGENLNLFLQQFLRNSFHV